MIRSAYRLDSTDFHRGLGRWQGHWIIISLEFEEISADEAIQALFRHGAGIIDDEVIGKATYNLIFRPKKEIRLRLAQLNDGDHAGLATILDPITQTIMKPYLQVGAMLTSMMKPSTKP